MLMAHVTLAENGTDNTARFRFTVNGSATTGSYTTPHTTAFSDSATAGETGTGSLVWVVDGLSGSNSFAVQWQNITGSPSADTAKPRTLQVLEWVGDDAVIRVNQNSTANVSSPTTWGSIFTSTGISVTATTSVVLMMSTVALTTVSDATVEFQFAVDGTREGAQTVAWSDNTNEGDGWAGVHVLDGISGSHAFSLQWQDVTNGRTQDSSWNSTYQVVEIVSNATLESEQSVTSSWAPGTAAFENDPTLDVDLTVGSTGELWLTVGNINLANGAGTDESIDFVLGVDDANDGAVHTPFTDVSGHPNGTVLTHVASGLSAGSHSFQVRGQGSTQGSPAVDATRPRSMFVIKHVQITYQLSGTTFDNAGSNLGSVDCYLFKDNQDGTLSFKDHTVSSTSTGNYVFSGVSDNDAQYLVYAKKDDTPHVMDVTDHVLQPELE